jgi:YcaO-like protein with predicted kinase domain
MDMRPGTHSFNTDRAVSPQETISRVQRFATALGITRVANLTGLDRTGIPVAMVCRPNSRSSAVFNGKGVDVPSAKASALMEAAETWHAENIRHSLRFASFADLEHVLPIVCVEGLARMPTRQFDPHLPILWVEGTNLIEDRAIWLPFEIVHADYRVSGPSPTAGCFAMSTNGLASGNGLPEALSHGLCEVIERDATSLWHQSISAEHSSRRLDLTTVDDPTSLDILDRLLRADLDVGVWDITTDVGVCTFHCCVVDRADDFGHFGVGYACHPTRAIALRRALLEAAQVRTTYIVGAREDIEPADYEPATMLKRNANVRAAMRVPERMRSFKSAPDIECDSCEAEVAWLLDKLRSIGLKQAVAVDLTQPEFGIPVVRVVVPGLEGSDHVPSQYSPGSRARVTGGHRL